MRNIVMYRLRPLMVATVLYLGAIASFAQGNQVDANRMSRDIDIMEKVINELFQHNFKTTRYSSVPGDQSAQGAYVPGYGVIFNTPYVTTYKSATRVAYSTTPNVTSTTHSATTVVINDKTVKYYGENKQKIASSSDSIAQVHTQAITKTMRDFLANYADAISQLDGNDRVLIIYDENARNSRSTLRVYNGEEWKGMAMPRITAEVKREDLISFRSGKMSRKELDNRIRVEKVSESREQFQEYKVFAGILESLFPVDNQGDYRVRNISYNFLPNFGVIYQMEMSMRKGSWNDCTSCPPGSIASGQTRSKSDTSQVRSRQVAYQKFGQDIREVLLDYGRTLRNLTPEQMILLTVSLPTCENCNVPDRVNVSVKKSVLEAYEKGQMDRRKALASIVFNE